MASRTTCIDPPLHQLSYTDDAHTGLYPHTLTSQHTLTPEPDFHTLHIADATVLPIVLLSHFTPTYMQATSITSYSCTSTRWYYFLYIAILFLFTVYLFLVSTCHLHFFIIFLSTLLENDLLFTKHEKLHLLGKMANFTLYTTLHLLTKKDVVVGVRVHIYSLLHEDRIMSHLMVGLWPYHFAEYSWPMFEWSLLLLSLWVWMVGNTFAKRKGMLWLDWYNKPIFFLRPTVTKKIHQHQTIFNDTHNMSMPVKQIFN
jgi:hypothetical protein